jgi:hypothetical protein
MKGCHLVWLIEHPLDGRAWFHNYAQAITKKAVHLEDGQTFEKRRQACF